MTELIRAEWKDDLLPVLTVHFIDGLELKGETYDEIVNGLRETSYNQEDNLEAYMKEVARRTAIQTGTEISWDTSEDFIKELNRAGIVTKILEH